MLTGKKKSVCLWVLLLILLFSSVCVSAAEDIPQLTIPNDAYQKTLEYQSEIQNAGLYCANNSWLFGVYTNNKGKLILSKWRFDSSDRAKVYTFKKGDYIINYPVSDDIYLYFTQYPNGIYRCRESDADVTRLTSTCGSFQMTKDWIYFSDEGDKKPTNYLYRMDKNGSGRTTVIERPVYCWFVFEEAILYQDDGDGESLHICDLNGSNDHKLNSLHSWGPIFDGNYIFYMGNETSDSENAALYRMKPDGSENTKIFSTDKVGEIAVYDKYVYFIDLSDSGRIYRVDKDGKELELIADDKNCCNLQVVAGYLNYGTLDKKGYYVASYRCAMDGSNKKTLWKDK